MKQSLTIPHLLQEKTKSSKTALIYYGKDFSYYDVGRWSRVFAKIFIDLGVRPGECIALMMSNVPQFVFSYYGALLAGAIVTPVNLLTVPVTYRVNDSKMVVPSEIQTQIEETNPSLTVAFDFYFPLLQLLQKELPKWKGKVILTSVQEYMPTILSNLAPIKLRQQGRWIKIKDKPEWVYSLSDLLQVQKSRSIQPFSTFPGMSSKESDLVQLQYTGGTTGTPKGIMLNHKNLLSNLQQVDKHLHGFIDHGKEVVLGVLPFFHMYGLTSAMHMTLLEQEGIVVLVAEPQDVGQWTSWIKQYRITVVPSVPRLYERILENNLLKPDLFSSVKIFFNGAGVLPKKTRELFEKTLDVKILEGYGLSEASPVVSACTPHNFKEGSIGKPLPDTEVRIVDLTTGDDASVGQEGEIVVRGPQVMQGYWQKPEETERVLRDGWLYTGDVGYKDQDGFLFITDRIKDMAKIHGENVFPAKVEHVLAGHPMVKEIAIVGVPDAEKGERLVACVVLQNKTDQEKAKGSILDYAFKHLAPHEVPRDIRFVVSLDPYKNRLGKVLKRQIREAIKTGKI